MIDSVLNGTGNSRFLKSAVPAGTSWADALAMLQAGTFPVDFNGINTEGFQQIGTPLNKANLLKDATAAQIGLPPSTTPDGMFQALGNTGELHVWRKTVTTTQEIPGGYTLGDALNDVFLVQNENSTSYVIAYVYLATSISANDDGVISADWGNRRTLSYNGEFVVNGPMYMKIDSVHPNSTSDFDVGDIVFIPSGYSTRTMRGTGGYSIYFDRCQKVNPYPKTPARTTTTYPVSTNPNAYQEGSNAKPAGYTLGEVKRGTFAMATGNVQYSYASSVSVSDDGTVSLVSPSSTTLSADASSRTIALSMRGKYVKATSSLTNCGVPFSSGSVVFLPADAVVSGTVDIDRYQPVTGYAAIPAGTTIEYLGKLGDKARVQVVSYVGTGTYGSGHKNSLTFDFVPKLVIVALSKDKSNNPNVMPSPQQGWSNMFLWIYGMKMTKTSSSELHFINDGKILSWYAYNYASNQCNESGSAYTAVAIG